MKVFIYYLIIINIIGFIVVFYDKRQAIKKKNRISEKNLLVISIIGGCYGFVISMYLFHHKTKKVKFKVLLPMINIIWLIIILGMM